MFPTAHPVPSSGIQEATIEDNNEDAWEALEIIPTSTANTGAGSAHTERQLSLQAPSNSTSIQVLQKRVEARRTLQKQLVEHPLQMFWSHFFYHLAREFWSLDATIRLAVLSLSLGASCKIFTMMTWYLWYPRTIFLSLILIASWLYLFVDMKNFPRRIEAFFERFLLFPDRILEALEHMDAKQARLVFLVLFFVPTLLQTRTILVLADINSAGGSLWAMVVASITSSLIVLLMRPPRSRTARDVAHVCLVVLYGAALLITLWQFKIMSLPRLAAPFFLSSCTLLLAYDENDSMDWCSGLVRSALRLALRDVLASVGTSVQEDEMLQIALLRWIVDYWGYQKPSPSPPSGSSAANESQSTRSPQVQAPNQELQWGELYPMLETAAEHMATEVQTLQQGASISSPQQSATTSGLGELAPAPESSSSQGASSLQGLHNLLATMDIDDRARPAVEAYKRHVEELPPSRDVALLVSILRRCPACFAALWQLMAVSTFQSVATTSVIVKMLGPIVVVEILRIRNWVGTCDSLSRMLDGIYADPTTERVIPQSTTAEPTSLGLLSSLLPHTDPMTILLSGDDDAKTVRDVTNETGSVTTQMKIPSLLIVWQNLKGSVSALEASLTAARCVQTGAIAVEFAKNVMSLTSLASEVSREGWMHGLALIAKEVVLHHGGDVTSRPRGSEATFTSSAVKAARNGQRVAHQLGVLAKDDGMVGQIVGPVFGFFGFIGSLFDPNKNGNNTEEGGNDGNPNNGNKTHSSDATPPSKADHTPAQTATSAPDEEDEDDDEGEWEATTAKKDDRVHKTAEGTSDTVSIPVPCNIGQEDGSDAARTQQCAHVAESKSREVTSEFDSKNVIASQSAIARADVAGSVVVTKEAQKEEEVMPHALELLPTETEWLKNKSCDLEVKQSSNEQTDSSAGTAEQGLDEEATASEELASVMELIAEAFERSIIDEVS